MKSFKPTRLALMLGIAFAAPNLLAQTATTPASPASQSATDVGRINVQGLPAGTDTGLISQEESPRARSSVNSEYLQKLNPSANPFQAIDLLPGVNTFSQDATGLFGGGIRVRGFAGDQMGLTINGAPVNDSGNFAVYPQEYTDTDNLCEVFLTQGSTDTDAPHVGASGGNLGMVTCAPKAKFGVQTSLSVGQLNYRRMFARVDTGVVGQSGLKSFISYSKTKADKFKGLGGADRDHVDFGAEMRPSKDLFFSASALYNTAVNNNIRTLTNAQIASSNRGLDFGANPPTHLTGVNGTAQTEAAPADGYYQFNINPFKNLLVTTKAEYKASKDLTLSAEPYYWYGFGTGGSQLQTIKENITTGTQPTRVSDVNKDGDALDTVMVYGSSVTRTYRPGVTLKGKFVMDNQNFNFGYWAERATHYQTGPRVTFDNAGNPASKWLDDSSKYLLRQDGSIYQARDWKTINSANSFYVQDNISLLKDALQLQMGVRKSTINRDFTNYANAGSTTATGRSDADYQTSVSYGKWLPNFGAKYNLDSQQSVFLNAAQNFRAPSNFVLSNLLQGGTVVNNALVGATLRTPTVGMETSNNFDLGYRLQTQTTTLSGSAFLVQFKNRIATSFNPTTLTSTDNNVGDSTMKGFELEAGQKLNTQLSIYGSLTYTDSKMNSDLRLANSGVAATLPTSGKQFPDTPKYLSALSLNYKSGNLFGRLTAKHTGSAYSTLVNDESMPAYTLFNLTAGYKLGSAAFFKDAEIRLNVDNLFNTAYQRSNSPSGSSFTNTAQGVNGFPASAPSYYVGAPRFTSLTLRANF